MAQRSATAVITGAGRGIGRATAIELAQAGYQIVVAGRDAVALAETVRLAGGGAALAVATDVTKPLDVDRLIAVTLEQFGRIDALVNNAGLAPVRSIPETTIEEWRAVVDT